MKEQEERFVVQPNALSRSMYTMSLTAKRLVAMAMSYLGQDIEKARKNEFMARFTVSEFMKTLGLERGTKTRKLIKNAIAEATKATVELEVPQGYMNFAWFSWTFLHTAGGRDIAWDWDKISLKFNPDLINAIGNFNKNFRFLFLTDISKLQSFYAIRFYEIALSWRGKAGKDGNAPGEWWFSYTLQKIRELFLLEPGKYKKTGDFRIKVIDNPISEINAKDVGIRIELEYRKRGRYLHEIIFHCREVDRAEPINVTPATQTEQESERITAAFPEEFEKYLAEAKAYEEQNPGLFIKQFPKHAEEIIQGRAMNRLKEAHPDFFKQGEPPTKRGRRKKVAADTLKHEP